MKSDKRISFEKNVHDAKWFDAFRDFNALSMYEMLRTYNELLLSERNNFWSKRDDVLKEEGGGCNPARKVAYTTDGERSRMGYAVEAVDSLQMPDREPPDTNQGEDCREFLAPVPSKLASVKFASLQQSYPMGTPDAAKQAIGGKVNAAWLENTCAVRVSRSLNSVGLLIPSSDGKVAVVSGADTRWYAFRQKDLQQWLRTNFGEPSVELKKPVNRRKLLRLKGIIGFTIKFDDATGHIDLWDGAIFNTESQAHSDYFADAEKVVLWRVHD